MREIRCKNCGKLLAKEKNNETELEHECKCVAKDKVIEIKCPRCKELNKIII